MCYYDVFVNEVLLFTKIRFAFVRIPSLTHLEKGRVCVCVRV